jgi:two-component system, LuxR family, response regulator FixJ
METSRQTIAVVDDDEMVRDSLRALLETFSYTVIDFADGDSYLERDPGTSTGCLILDAHMPRKSGFEVLRALRTSGDMTPVILITGRNDRLLEARAQAESSVVILDKPFPKARLLAAIESALSDSRSAGR